MYVIKFKTNLANIIGRIGIIVSLGEALFATNSN